MQLIQQQFVVTNRYTGLEDRVKVDRSSTDQHISMLRYRDNMVTNSFIFCGHKILTKGVRECQFDELCG